MSNATVSPSPSPKRRRWLRVLALTVGVLFVLLVVVYFVATSSAFLKGVILPKVSAAMNATITVSDASISPFSQVVLHDLKVQTTGSEPLLAASEVRLRYSLMAILGGNIKVDEVAISSPAVVLVQNPDGTSNLDPILKGQKAAPAEKKPAPAKPSKPPQVDIAKVALNDATIRQIKLYTNGNRDVAELTHVNVTLSDLKNGQTGKLTLGADIDLNNNPPSGGAGALQAKLDGNFSLALDAALKPASAQGNVHLQVAHAQGVLEQAEGFGAQFDCDVTATEVKQIALHFQRAATSLGEVRVAGPFDLEKTEGHLTVQVLGIDKRLLNLAGATSGLDFGPTTLTATNDIQLAKGGATITATGQLDLNRLQVTRAGQTTPSLDFRAAYGVTVDKAAGNAVLQTFTLNGTQTGKPIVQGGLTSPMTFSWGGAAGAVGDSTLTFTVAHLDLADWKPFMGDAAPAGEVNLQLKLLSQQAGKQLTFDLNSDLDNLAARMGSNRISQVTVSLQANGKAVDFQQFNLANYKLQVAHQSQPVAVASGAGTYDKATSAADIQLDAQLTLARLAQMLAAPDLEISSGTAGLKVRVTQKQGQQDVAGTLTLADFTGKSGSTTFRNFGADGTLDVGMNTNQVQIRKVAARISESKSPGGTFELSGTYTLASKAAQLSAKLTDFNQNGLRPFLESMLADKKLVSVALNGDASVHYDPEAASGVKSTLQVTNLVVNDPKGTIPATPLQAGMLLDASLDKKVAEVRQCQLSLTPTARATNQIQFTGRLDMTRTNATEGSLKLNADSLDLTTYYDLFGGQKQAATRPAAPSAAPKPSTSAAGGPEKEPQGTQLPLRNFSVAANVRRLYLREVEVADFQLATKIDGGHVALTPCKLTLNGAPIDANVDLDLGVPGYKYNVAFDAIKVPLAPLVDSFQPERKGALSGAFTAQVKVTGAGTTGANLQKNLAGQFDVGSTNLNLSIDHVESPMLKSIVSVVASLPELISNPEAAVVGWFGGNKQGGLGGALEQSPIDQIYARGNIGSGQVNLQAAVVRSPAFEADASGTVTLAPILTNSVIQIPVAISLSRSLAERINLVSANTPTNAAYVALPNFLTMRGTAGQPKTDINKVALAGAVVKSLGGAFPKLGGNAGGVVKELGGLLGGGTQPATNASTGTNAAPPKESPVNSLLNDLLRPRNEKK